jgi:diadenosine tetraphosphate (Ap4A) HIT family hydrolase
MSAWNDPAAWRALKDGSACPICRRGEPRDLLLELETSWLSLPGQAPMVGYACLVSKIHAVELHDLTELQAEAFMRDARRASKAIAAATGAVKLNYEVHGNTIPHLHLHLFPRYPGDPFEGGPIDPRKMRVRMYAAGALEAMQARVLQLIHASGWTASPSA